MYPYYYPYFQIPITGYPNFTQPTIHSTVPQYYPFSVQNVAPMHTIHQPRTTDTVLETPPRLRTIEIRQENDGHINGEIPVPEEIVRSMNDLVTQLVHHVNEETNTTQPVHHVNEETNTTQPETDNTVSLKISDLINHTQLRYYQSNNSAEAVEQICPICHNDMNSCIVRILRCSHTFHNDCIDHWFSIASNCPLCRVPVIPTEEHVV